MPHRHLLILSGITLALGVTASSAQELLLYTPTPTAVEQAPPPAEGVLVKTVTVKRGDTLRKLSRKHIGVASWFPQVLVFNTIKNPDLIHPGDRLLFPVRAGEAASKQKVAKGKKSRAPRRSAPAAKPRAAKPQVVSPAAVATPPAAQNVESDEQNSFQKGQQAYLARDYQKALEQFSSFLRRFPQSRYAADAALYRAESLLRLSEE